MKRSEAVEILCDILKEWDGCLIDKRAGRQILNKIEDKIGMKPPGKWVESKLFGQSFKHEWDQSPKKRKKK